MTSYTSAPDGPARRRDQQRVDASTAELASLYKRRRLRVDRAYRKMQAIAVRGHQPADARRCSADLAFALRAASATASQALVMLQQPVASPRRWRRHKAVRTVPAEVLRWSVQLVRLSEIEVWLRRTTLDDPGVHVPNVVRVASRAASGPHIAGMVLGADEPVESILRNGRIGVALTDIVDGGQPQPPTEARPAARLPVQAA